MTDEHILIDCEKCDRPHVQPTCPWEQERCGVEGCRYEITDDDGCGLFRLTMSRGMTARQAVAESARRWDAGNPVERLCLASQRAESIDFTGQPGEGDWR